MKPARAVAIFLALVVLTAAAGVRASASRASTHLVFLPVVSNLAPLNVDPFAHGSVGYDISFPGCGEPAPPSLSSIGTPYRFAVVGVNGGKAFENNPCLASEYDNAIAQNLLVAFYLNVNAPIGTTAGNGNTGPDGTCAPGDDVCLSYNYGYNAAQDADQTAIAVLGSNAVVGRTWWLDVETANSWWIDQNPPPPNATALDDQVIQGAIDYFHQNGVTVGSYSISSMWAQGQSAPPVRGMGHTTGLIFRSQILGNNDAPGIPEWVSGASSLASAPSFCGGSSFTGGSIWLVQEPLDNFYDEDYAC